MSIRYTRVLLRTFFVFLFTGKTKIRSHWHAYSSFSLIKAAEGILSLFPLLKKGAKSEKYFFPGFFIIKIENFCHIFHVLHLFKALRLFFWPNFPGPTFISCSTSIPESRVFKVSAQGT